MLKPNGTLISGFTNPLLFIFDEEEELKGNLVVKHSVPSSSLTGLTDKEVEAGFVITGFYEDDFGGNRPLDPFINTFMVTKAVKLKDS